MSSPTTPVPTFPAKRLGDPSEPATWDDLPIPVKSHASYVDFEADNSLRASWAAAALKPYAEFVLGWQSGAINEDPSTAMQDLLADLRHLADAMGIDFEDVYANAAAHYHLDLEGRMV